MIKGQQERVGLIIFSSQVREAAAAAELATNRTELVSTITALNAGGDTSLLDAISLGYDQLQALQDKERINAIVVMTDGKENNSRITLRELTNKMQRDNQSGVPVVVFCVAYGSDAEMNTLEAIAEATGGQARRGSTETIQQLYKLLSTYF